MGAKDGVWRPSPDRGFLRWEGRKGRKGTVQTHRTGAHSRGTGVTRVKKQAECQAARAGQAHTWTPRSEAAARPLSTEQKRPKWRQLWAQS